MRIQLNKSNDYPYYGHDELIQSNRDSNLFFESRQNDLYDAYFCENCGTEVFAHWHSYSEAYIAQKCSKYSFQKYNEGSDAKRINANYQSHRKMCETEQKKLLASDAVKKCPVCGSAFSPIQAHNDDIDFDANMDTEFEILRENFELHCEDIAKEDAQSFAETANHQCFPTPIADKGKISAIKSDPEQLKAYILSLIQLETNIMTLPKQLEKLYYQLALIQAKVRIIDAAPLVEQYHQMAESRFELQSAEQAYQRSVDRLTACKAKRPKPTYPSEPQKPTVPVYQKPGLFNKKKINAENDELKAKYEAELQEYEFKMKLHRQTIANIQNEAQEQHNAAIKKAEEEVALAKKNMENIQSKERNLQLSSPVEVCSEKAAQKMIQQEIEQVEDLLRSLCQTRCDLYALDIVFGKYRDIVALSTFYEYLMAGRCTTLEGATGAYNLYESEIRTNLIISQLSDVIKSLDKIQQNQYMIYSQLQQMNSTLNSLSRTMDAAYTAITKIKSNTDDMNKYMAEVSKNTKVIAHNTAATAYYSKVNAELTNALGFMVALK